MDSMCLSTLATRELHYCVTDSSGKERLALSALKCSYCSKSTDLILCKFISSICYSVSRARAASNVIIVHMRVHTRNMA